MDTASEDGQAPAERRPKPRVCVPHPSLGATISRERYFDLTATVTIRGFGDPDKEALKYLQTLRHIVDLAFPDASVDFELTLP